MRLQLTAAALSILALTARPSKSQPVVEADARASLYDDSDATTITTATGVVRGTIAELVTLKGRYLADIISSASVDIVSAATASFDEVRHEAEGALGYADGTFSANAGYIHSNEPDWYSHTINAGVGHDFLKHQLTLGLGGTLVLNTVGRVDDDNFERDLTVGSGTASATVVASQNDLLSFAYSLAYSTGYHASPYRFAYLTDPAGTGVLLGPPETHPIHRTRHALALRYNRYLFRNSSLRSHLRGYIDDWGIKSVTVGTEYVIGIPPVELGVRVRGYLQSEAEFYEAVYSEPRRYMTADREMGAFIDGFVGGKVGVRHRFGGALDTLTAEVRVDGFGFKYFDFPRLPTRSGIIGEAGMGATF